MWCFFWTEPRLRLPLISFSLRTFTRTAIWPSNRNRRLAAACTWPSSPVLRGSTRRGGCTDGGPGRCVRFGRRCVRLPTATPGRSSGSVRRMSRYCRCPGGPADSRPGRPRRLASTSSARGPARRVPQPWRRTSWARSSRWAGGTGSTPGNCPGAFGRSRCTRGRLSFSASPSVRPWSGGSCCRSPRPTAGCSGWRSTAGRTGSTGGDAYAARPARTPCTELCGHPAVPRPGRTGRAVW